MTGRLPESRVYAAAQRDTVRFRACGPHVGAAGAPYPAAAFTGATLIASLP
ncbi:hypothetical protein ACVW16_004679 [Bradyrhizobium sp. USDA 4474]